MAVNASANVYAATTFSGIGPNGNTAVTYTMSCGSPNACGTFATSDEVGAVLYKAPPAIPSGAVVTITATSVANPTLSRTASVTIVPPIPISVSFFAHLPASLQVNASTEINVNIQNDTTTNPQVKWTATCTATNCGSFSATETADEVMTTYTAPPTIPSGNTVTITATSVTDPTKSVSGSIVITALAPTLANGTYVYQVTGPGLSQASFITGVFIAQNGMITGGEQDSVFDNDDDNGGPYSYFQQFSVGSYTTTPDGNLAVNIQLGPGNTETLNGTLASNQKGFVAGVDGTMSTGSVELQTSTSPPSGGYAISLDPDSPWDGSPWIDGIINVDGVGGISGKGSVLDINSEGSYYSGTQMLGPSTVAAPDAYGRVVFTLNPASNSSQPVLYVAAYPVDSAHMRVIDIGNAENSFVVPGVNGGVAFSQGANTGNFSAATVAGSTYVFAGEGWDQQGGMQIAGVLTLSSGGKVTGSLNWNDLSASVPQNPVAFSGSYSVDPTGRVALTNLTDGSTFNYSMHLYLNGQGSGILLSSDSADVFTGQLFLQQSSAFNAASFSGSYGMNASVFNDQTPYGPEFGNAVGPLTATPNAGLDDVAGYADLGAGVPDFAISGSLTPSANGDFTGSLTGFDAASPGNACTFVMYMVDNTQGIAVETDREQLTLARFALVQ